MWWNVFLKAFFAIKKMDLLLACVKSQDEPLNTMNAGSKARRVYQGYKNTLLRKWETESGPVF